MVNDDELVVRLQAYGTQLQAELADWPALIPDEPTGIGVPMRLLRRRLGWWAGHRLSFGLLVSVALAVTLAVGLAIVLLTNGGERDIATMTTRTLDPAPSAAEPATVEPIVAEELDSTPQAAAQPADPAQADSPVTEGADSITCQGGEPSGHLCRTTSAAVTFAGDGSCDPERGFVQEGTDCYRIAAAIAVCAEETSHHQSDCVAIGGTPTALPPTCGETETLAGDQCQVLVPALTRCVEGQMHAGECVVQLQAEVDEMVCPFGDPDRSADQCMTYSPVDCGDMAAVPGGCRLEGVVRHSERCPELTQLADGRCEPTAGCDQNYAKTIGPCGDAAVVELVCSLTDAPVASAAECGTMAPGSCQIGTLSLGQCIELHPLASAGLTCPAESTVVELNCVRIDTPSPYCETGELTSNDTCVVESTAATVELVCPVGATVVGDSCAEHPHAGFGCTDGVLRGADCWIRVEAQNRVGCEPGTIRVFDSCVRYEQPTVNPG